MYELSIISTSNKSLVEDVASVLFEDIHTITSKYNYSPFIFSNNKRNAENSTPQNIVCFDVDDGMNLNEAIEICQNFKSLVITSKSHKKDKKGLVADRFRIIIPIDKNIPKEYFKTFYELLSQYLGFNTIDKSCNDLARFFYPNNSQEVHYSTSSSIISFDEVMSHYEPVDTPKRDYQVQTYTYSKDLKSNELDSNFVFKDGSRFCDYENISVGETIPIRCFNPHHEDKHPSAFIGRSATSQKLMVSCSSCNDTKFISYESERENISTHSPLNAKTNELINKSNTDIIANSGAKVAEKIVINALDMLKNEALSKEDIINLKDIEMLVQGFLPHNHITLFYAPSNIGKTTSTMGLINHILGKNQDMECYYFDYDNGANTMKPHLLKVLENVNSFKYISFDNTPRDKLFQLIDILPQNDLSKALFVFDSLQHFVSSDLSSSKSEPEVKELLEKFKRLRKSGATIIILNHTTKEKNAKGKETTFRGLNIIKDNVDNMFFLTRQDDKNYVFANEKKRADIKTVVKAKYNHSLVLIESFDTITHKEFEQLISEENDRYFIDTVQGLLRLKGSMTQSDLANEIKAIDDFSTVGINKIIDTLKFYQNKFWKIKRTGERLNINSYTIIDTFDNTFSQVIENLKR